MRTNTPVGELVPTKKVKWVGIGSMTSYKLLWLSDETGAWTMLVKAKAGAVNAKHRHLGPADFFVFEGQIDYEGGSATTGDWIYEPAGAIHAATSHPIDTVYLANVRGPLELLDENDEVLHVLDGFRFQAMVEHFQEVAV